MESIFTSHFYLDVKVDSNHEIDCPFIEKYLNLRAMLLYIIFPDVLRFIMEFFSKEHLQNLLNI